MPSSRAIGLMIALGLPAALPVQGHALLADASEGLSLQASLVGSLLAVPEARPPRSPAHTPMEALANLFAHLGESPRDEEFLEFEHLDTLPPESATALAALIAGLARFQGAAEQGQEALPASVAYLSAAAHALARALDLEGTLGPPFSELKLRYGHVVSISLGNSDDTYYEATKFLLDFGGNDTYYNNAGGSNLRLGSCLGGVRESVSALIDLSGNDRYVSDLSCGINGGCYRWHTGARAAGLLLDLRGHDVYRAGWGGTNGGADRCHGFLLDFEGDDEYVARDLGTNGGGAGGTGFLFDGGGNDTYRGGTFAAVNGGGAIAGGRGLLVDRSGDDVYLGGCCGSNGGGAWDAAEGALLDFGGDDVYVGGHGGVNGGAIGARGQLLDCRGNDVYVATRWGVNGGAEQVALNPLLWLPEEPSLPVDDVVRGLRDLLPGLPTEGLAPQGLDDKLWAVAEELPQTLVHEAWLRLTPVSPAPPGLGYLLDLQGRDTYWDEEHGGRVDETVVPKGLVGAQVDLSADTAPAPPFPWTQFCPATSLKR